MRLCVHSATAEDFSTTLIEENWPPYEMEYRIVQLAEEQYPTFGQLFFHDSEDNPALDLIQDGRIIHKIRFEYEV